MWYGSEPYHANNPIRNKTPCQSTQYPCKTSP